MLHSDYSEVAEKPTYTDGIAVTLSASAVATAIWTPAAADTFVVTDVKFYIWATADVTVTGGGPLEIRLIDGTGHYDVLAIFNPLIPAGASVRVNEHYPTGFRSESAGQALQVRPMTAFTGGSMQLSGLLFGRLG